MFVILRAVRLAPSHRSKSLDVLHFLSSGAVGFARGLNDTPKIAALLMVVTAVDIRWGLVLVGVAMAVGGLMNAHRVAMTMSRKITGMNPGEGFAANLATALLVTSASFHGLPVSTTHVSVGALVGIGSVHWQAHWKAVGQIVLSWIVTLPCGAALAAAAYFPNVQDGGLRSGKAARAADGKIPSFPAKKRKPRAPATYPFRLPRSPRLGPPCQFVARRFLPPHRFHPMKLLPCLMFLAGVASGLAAPATDGDAKSHWSFQPLTRPAVPEPVAASLPNSGPVSPSRAAAPISNPIDGFIAAKLAENALTFFPPADPVTWLRRVTLDLTGLPPTQAETEKFLTEKSRQAAVDRLLASPHYGERQAQHWLDVVRYADTHGFEVNTERPNAWPYRDYIIDAFNKDIPYDEFIRCQIAGDNGTSRRPPDSWSPPPFCCRTRPARTSPRNGWRVRMPSMRSWSISVRLFSASASAAHAVTTTKFDPVTARDYYAMQAFVAGVEYGEQDLNPAQAVPRGRKPGSSGMDLADLDRKLSILVPLAKSGHVRP